MDVIEWIYDVTCYVGECLLHVACVLSLAIFFTGALNHIRLFLVAEEKP